MVRVVNTQTSNAGLAVTYRWVDRDSLNLNMVEIVGKMILIHIGRASESIWGLIFSGRSPGVKRSTFIPSRIPSS